MKKLSLTFLFFLLSGCVTYTNPVPPGYRGPISDVYDSVKYVSDTESQFFVLSKVNGKYVENSLQKTTEESYGKGCSIIHMEMGRGLPSGKLEVELLASTYHAAPILALRGRNYRVQGVVLFDAVEGESYIVKGVLSEARQAVWIENAKTGETVTEVVETQ